MATVSVYTSLERLLSTIVCAEDPIRTMKLRSGLGVSSQHVLVVILKLKNRGAACYFTVTRSHAATFDALERVSHECRIPCGECTVYEQSDVVPDHRYPFLSQYKCPRRSYQFYTSKYVRLCIYFNINQPTFGLFMT